MAGWRYAFFHFDQRFPLSSLRVRWAAKERKAEAYRVQRHLLLAYLHWGLTVKVYPFLSNPSSAEG